MTGAFQNTAYKPHQSDNPILHSPIEYNSKLFATTVVVSSVINSMEVRTEVANRMIVVLSVFECWSVRVYLASSIDSRIIVTDQKTDRNASFLMRNSSVISYTARQKVWERIHISVCSLRLVKPNLVLVIPFWRVQNLSTVFKLGSCSKILYVKPHQAVHH